MRVLVFCAAFFIPGIILNADPLPDFFIPLRDAVYEQNLTADEITGLYRETKARTKTALSGMEQFVALSRCEYMMGRAYQYEERKDEAAARYGEGIGWAEKALDAGAGEEAWQMLAENISQSCAVKSVSYAMANGLKVEKYAKNALELNPRNAAALYMVAARWVFAPPPFHNYKKGIQMMEDIIANGDMQRDDSFNVYSAIGYAYYQQKKFTEARPWFLKSLEVYPTNKYVRGLLEKS
ncbi:MAG: tetratricopeptide repeat protein [Treponema sp.]|jgi:tetratricopeptide (TPR) repeat protein|nr:tetratricopeptide repeat protein [Treponema sp.]